MEACFFQSHCFTCSLTAYLAMTLRRKIFFKYGLINGFYFLGGERSTPPLDFLAIGFSGKKNGGNGDKFKIGVFILSGCGIPEAIFWVFINVLNRL